MLLRPVGPFLSSGTAAHDPCAASEVAKTVGSVVISAGTYLDAHPATNQALTTISRQQAGPQSLGALKNYFDANPQVGKDIQQLQQPLANLSARCKLPVTLAQLTSLMQAAQQSGGAPTSLPGAVSTAQSGGSAAGASQPPSSVASSPANGVAPAPSGPIAGLP